MTNEEVSFIINAIEELAKNHKNWIQIIRYNTDTNEFKYINDDLLFIKYKKSKFLVSERIEIIISLKR